MRGACARLSACVRDGIVKWNSVLREVLVSVVWRVVMVRRGMWCGLE